MFNSLWSRTDLRRLIVLLTVMSIMVTLVNTIYATYRVQRELLVSNTLESNRVYAAKLAASTEIFFRNAQQQLAYSAQEVANRFEDNALLDAEAERLRAQTDSFNSVAIVDSDGVVRAVSPPMLRLKGRQLDSPSLRQALKLRKPLISQPFLSSANNMLVLISHPVINRQGRYLGYVSGSLYLKRKSILSELLAEQYYRDGSYLYVVDDTHHILYDSDVSRIGKVTRRQFDTGAAAFGGDNAQGSMAWTEGNEHELVGYARVPSAGWTIVAVRGTDATLKPMEGLILKVIGNSAPWLVITLLFAWQFARLIAQPLWQLARRAGEMNEPAVSNNIKTIKSWYFEASQLKKAMLIGIDLLHQRIGSLVSEVLRDPLTGLSNRRGLYNALESLRQSSKRFTVIALDIDHFKRVNDLFGHDVGDTVIRNVAAQLRHCSREADIVCRSGGEEFLLLLPEMTMEASIDVAERIRRHIAECEISVVGHITVSVGVASSPAGNDDIPSVLKLADDALYQAKREGRNRVVSLSAATVIPLED
ncbi:sensor domain-containing diguanylate cyclase [Biostraticola tofi]|uniref:diguanylate cyclase n=1 Tax=Biostraticola tofi TaxID=466109 RepID=A0A4R3YXV6_9GAMM|nr:sensor domain-containing diguanylate cyclase [Biostraticola tofi]TCV96698.1 diguanylate cyclase (GGDEF)-like protein [Biostraticola tofi]